MTTTAGAASRVTVAELARLVPDGSSVVAGGLPLWRKPIALIDAIVQRGARGLHYSSFLASLDAELLVAGGCVTSLEYGYLGRDLLGSSRFMATATGFERRTRTEFEYWPAVQAAASGAASLPDAFGAAVQARQYDLCLLHASYVDAAGNVYAGPLDLMEEDDRVLVAASRRLLVTVERQCDRVPAGGVLMATAKQVLALAVAPGGSRPLGMAGFYPPDVDRLRAELPAVG